MKVALVGSRSVTVEDFGQYVSVGDEIVSGGAVGVDRCAAEYARRHRMRLRVFLPEYNLYGRAAPIVRNKQIVDYADKVVVFWNGQSKGTLSVIKYAKRTGKECLTVICEDKSK